MIFSKLVSASSIAPAAACALAPVVMGCNPPNPLNACEYQSIQAAIDDAPDNWQISICSGVHQEAILVNKPLTLVGASRDGTVLTGGNTGAVVSVIGVDEAVVIRQLTLKPAVGTTKTRYGVVVQDANHVTIDDLSVDMSGVDDIMGPPGTAAAGFTGIDLSNSTVNLSKSTVTFKPTVAAKDKDLVSVGVRVRGVAKVQLTAVEVDDAGGAGVESSGTDTTLDTITIRRSGTDGVDMLSGTLNVTNATIDGATRDALRVTGGAFRGEGLTITSPLRYGVLAGGGTLELHTSKIQNAGAEGIHASLGVVSATECTIENAGNLGLYVRDSGAIAFDKGTVTGGMTGALLDYTDAYITISNSTIQDTVGRGLLLYDGQLFMAGGVIQNTGAEGVYADGKPEGAAGLDLADVTVKGCQADGIVLKGKLRAGLEKVTVSDNKGWGLTCDGGDPGMTQSSVDLTCVATFMGNGAGADQLVQGCQTYMCIAPP